MTRDIKKGMSKLNSDNMQSARVKGTKQHTGETGKIMGEREIQGETGGSGNREKHRRPERHKET